MRIDGEWYECDDGFVRPVIRGQILSASKFWEPTLFLVDTGADRTVISAAILEVLGFEPTDRQALGGVGGLAESVTVSTEIRLPLESGAVHEPRAGSEEIRGQARGHLGVRLLSLRDSHGKPAFWGETVSDTMAAILKNEPDWDKLPACIPPAN